MSSARKDVIWSFIGTFFRLGGSILILPLVLKKFNSDELGLWYLFTTIGNFILMVDIGFSPTISRSMRYVLANGCLYKNSLSKTEDNFLMIKLEEFYYLIRRIYSILALLSLLLLVFCTFFIIKTIYSSNLNFHESIIAWATYGISIVLNLRYYYRGAILTGLDKIFLNQKIEVISSLANYLIVAICIMFNIGLLSLAIGVLIGLLIRVLLFELNVDIKPVKLEKEKTIKATGLLWPNTWKTGVSNIMGYLIKYLNSYFITQYLGLIAMGSYGLTLQIVMIITSVSNIWVNTIYPKLSTFKASNDGLKFKQLFYRRFKLAILTYVLLSVGFFFIGNLGLEILGSNTLLLGKGYLIFFLCYMFADFITNIYGYIIMIGNRVPFVLPTVITSILIVLLNIIFHYFSFGLWGILLSTALAGGFFNYWYWPIIGHKEVIKLGSNGKRN